MCFYFLVCVHKRPITRAKRAYYGNDKVTLYSVFFRISSHVLNIKVPYFKVCRVFYVCDLHVKSIKIYSTFHLPVVNEGQLFETILQLLYCQPINFNLLLKKEISQKNVILNDSQSKAIQPPLMYRIRQSRFVKNNFSTDLYISIFSCFP